MGFVSTGDYNTEEPPFPKPESKWVKWVDHLMLAGLFLAGIVSIVYLIFWRL